jgi:hypothetical protein
MSDKGNALLNISDANNSWNEEALRLSREIRSVRNPETKSEADVPQDQRSTPVDKRTNHKNR